MSKLVSKVLAAGAAVSMLTLPGLSPAVAAPGLGAGQSSTAGAGDSHNDANSADESSAQAAASGTQVQLLNITDFHGRISDAGTQVASVVEEERAAFAEKGDTGMLSAGDNIGASPYNSSSAKDTPTIDVLNAIGVQASAVGNHEFDRGLADLSGRVVDEADFPYLAANVYDKGSQNVADGLDEYTIVDVGEVKVAVIGVVTKETATLVSPAGIADIEFGDPTDAVNRVADEIEELPGGEQPDMTVVEAHLGASSTENLEDAKASNAEFEKLVTKADASIDVLFTGHTHLPYSFEAPVPGDADRTRPVLEAGNYGEYVGQVQLTADGEGNWTTDTAELIDTEDKSYDSPVVDEVEKIIADADEAAKGPGSVVHGKITEDITRAKMDGNEDRGAESTLGNLVADALKDGVEDSQLPGADFGITNPGGLRTDLLCDHIYGEEEKCEVTAAELNEVLPFANDHGVVTMTGEDVIGLFEEQWQPEGARNAFLHLGISDEVDVVYDSNAERGEHVKSVEVNGQKVDPNADYRVATLSFLAAGGDNFSSFAKGDFEQSGLTDFDTWVSYFEKNTPVAPDENERQADLAEDVIDQGDLTAELTGPKTIAPGESADFKLKMNAKSEVAGPIDVSVDVPEGFAAEAAGASSQTASAKGPEVSTEATAATITLDSIAAGESETSVTVTAPEDASGDVTVTVGVQANSEGPWWDDNPLPIAHEFATTAAVSEDAGASAGDDGAADGGAAGGGDSASGADGSADDGGANAAEGADAAADGGEADGSGSNANGSADGSDLPRTGFETFNVVAAALALIVAGGTAITVVRRRRISI
ncbi:bifunctional metallophosphatase/5'-nucleotidase [Brevibacterium renqingii]|uniref:bifunctional metallophosphatase/5'-nucleotidase n=1 Tax=Brevibacterium renqingii TaxID=2776916 RepID=UPI001ADEECAD|nr:bifunctional UDP-sugar hydrolase/5'-nucleotidase [Brevibacterium renqingii]